MTRQTSIEVYHQIEAEGLLSRLRLDVYRALFHEGPMTQMETCRLLQKTTLPYTLDHSILPRFAELKRAGVITETEERTCSVTGRNVLTWDVTNNLPKKLEKKTVAPRWIKHQPEKLVYDGSRWAVALQVHNKETGKTNWEIDTVAVSCDEESFSMTALCDGESADPYSSWSWEDFEFVFPMNSEARMTIKEWWKE